MDLGESFPSLEKTPGVLGGAARIVRTRVPVWTLVQARKLGMSEAELLKNYPSIRRGRPVPALGLLPCPCRRDRRRDR